MGSRTLKDEAIVLRSLRFGEADRILHLFTKDHGRINAIAKGARRTRSRLGGRLEPMSRVELLLHEGRGELATVTGADLLQAHHAVALDPYRVAVGSIGLEAMLRLFIERDANPRAFHALARFLDVLDAGAPARAEHAPLLQGESAAESAGARPLPPARADPVLDPLALSFQLKLLWLAGYLPHLASCAACGGEGPLVAFSAAAGGGVCAVCRADSVPLSAEGFLGLRALLERPLAEARDAGLTAAVARESVRVVQTLYEYHGGFRMRTLAAR